MIAINRGIGQCMRIWQDEKMGLKEWINRDNNKLTQQDNIILFDVTQHRVTFCCKRAGFILIFSGEKVCDIHYC